MRSTMRQLLGGKKSHKNVDEDNRSSDLPPPKVHTAIAMRNETSGNGDSLGAKRNAVHIPGGRMNDHNYDHGNSSTGNPIPNSYENGFEKSMVQGMQTSFDRTVIHGVESSHGNTVLNTMGMANAGFRKDQASQNPYRPDNIHDDLEVFNTLNRDQSKVVIQPNGMPSHFDPVNAVSKNTRYMESPARTVANSRHDPTSPRSESRKVAERSRYVDSASTTPPTVYTGTVGESSMPNYLKCEDEPIRTPGAIQSLGALIGLKYNETGDLEVRIASENTRKVIGYGPEQLFALGSFLDILTEDVRQTLTVHLDCCLKSASKGGSPQTSPQIFKLILTFPYEPDCHLWCSMHLAPNVVDLVICEFEDYSEDFYQRDVDAARALPKVPLKAGDFDITQEQLKLSTISASKPLLALQIAQQRASKELTSLDMFSCMSQAQSQISECTEVQKVEEVVVGIISELIGFHRVMFYRFDEMGNGCVEAELVNLRASTDIFRGLHYPASDIPPQARDLYKINRIRILYDRDSETSRLVCRDETDFKDPLDLTHCYLRAMSPIHIIYLRNMGVRSSVSISVVIDDKLWGLIACHGYGEHGSRVSLPVRDLCRSIGECAASNIQRLLAMKRVLARKLQSSLPTNSMYPPGDLLSLVDADFAALSIDNKVRAIGRMEPFDEASAVISYLQSCRVDRITSSHSIKDDFPKLYISMEKKTLAGLLIVPLNVGKENDFLVFFRKGQLRHINWAGNPSEKIYKGQAKYLEPRQSFQRFIQTINHTSKPWTEDQLDTASILALLYGRFAETWRIKAQGVPNLKDKESSKETNSSPVDDTFNLKAAATRVLDALKKEAQRKALDLTVSVHDALPTTVIGDADCFKQVMLYFIRNGFKSSQSLKVDVNLIRVQEETSYIELKVQDAGPGMTESELDDTFQEFERAQSEEKWPFPNQRSSPNQNESNRGNVTLSVVATFVRSINGQIQVTSELGKGTIFTVELPYKCALGTDNLAQRKPLNYNMPLPAPPRSPASMGGRKTRSVASNRAANGQPYVSGQYPYLEDQKRPSSGPQAYTYDHPIVDDATTIGRNSDPHAPPIQYDSNSLQYQSRASQRQQTPELQPIHVLIADSDLVSLRLIEEKLLQFGYSVTVAHDGQECHDCFAVNPAKIDVILMELKMPFVDGVLSTRMIRIAEKEAKHRAASEYSQYSKQRVPIIAISYTLDEESRFDYIQSGLDGWILKPIDYNRLSVMLQGINNPQLRQEALYVPGQLKKGGWFLP